ncbi:MAG: GyrI-like domain-containing protein [Nitratireductor sp.]
MEKLDFKKRDKQFYTGRHHKWVRLNVPAMNYLTIEGIGSPDGDVFSRAIAALYPIAYGLKFMHKTKTGDFVVPPLEGQWWADNPDVFMTREKDKWCWKLGIRLPVEIPESDVEEIRASAILKNAKKKEAPTNEATLRLVTFETIQDGDSLQCLHKGPFEDETEALIELHGSLMPQMGLTFNGHHREIYLSDPRKSAPEKLKTILRQPVKAV